MSGGCCHHDAFIDGLLLPGDDFRRRSLGGRHGLLSCKARSAGHLLMVGNAHILQGLVDALEVQCTWFEARLVHEVGPGVHPLRVREETINARHLAQNVLASDSWHARVGLTCRGTDSV